MKEGLTSLSRYSTASGRLLMRTILLPSLLLSCMLGENVLAAQYWGITDTKLPYIAKIRELPNERAIVIYNPDTCEQIGAACGFFIEHASAHAHLNHLLLPPEAYSPISEMQADCWVAKNGNPEEVYAAVQLFLDDSRISNLNITGDPVQRARKVRVCAIETGNWIGN